MHITLLEVHLDDVAVAVSGGDREARASTEPEPGVEVELDAGEAAPPDAVPRGALAFALVPIFVALGVVAGFLAARRLRRPQLPNGADTVDVEIATETETEFH
jgi:hypothetical protein